MNKFNIHFPNGAIKTVTNDEAKSSSQARAYSFYPNIDCVFWISKHHGYRYFQIAEVLGNDVFVEEIDCVLYLSLTRTANKNFFFFDGEILYDD